MKKGWKIEKLDDVCRIEMGKTPPRGNKKYWDTDKATRNVWLSIADLNNTEGKIVSDSKEYISNEGVKLCKTVKKGTLLVSFKLTLGRLAFAGKDLFTNEAIAALSIKDEKKLSKEFLYWYLSFFDWDAATGGDVKVKGKTLNKEKLKQIPVPIPPLPEQQRIVSVLDEAFASIAQAKSNAERNLVNARELFESYLKSVFETKSDDWEEKTLGDIGKVSMCKRVYKEQTKTTGDIPFYKIGTFGKEPDVFIPKSLYDEFRNKFSFPKKGDILISAAGTIGRRVKYDGEPAYFQDSNIVWIDNDEKQVLNDYLYQFYGACNWNSTTGATIPRLYNDNLRQIEIHFPKSLAEQRAIVGRLEALSAETGRLEEIYEAKVEGLEELKKSVLGKAFGGEL